MPGWRYAFTLPGEAVTAATPPGTVILIGESDFSLRRPASSMLTRFIRTQRHPSKRPICRPRRQVSPAHGRSRRPAELAEMEKVGLYGDRGILCLHIQLHLGVYRPRTTNLEQAVPPRPKAHTGADATRCGTLLRRGNDLKARNGLMMA